MKFLYITHEHILMIYYKVFGWVLVVFGAFAIFGSLNPLEGYGVMGGVLFFSSGACILSLSEKR